MYLGMRPAEAPYVLASKGFTALYFLYFTLWMPALSLLNRAALGGTPARPAVTLRQCVIALRDSLPFRLGAFFGAYVSLYPLQLCGAAVAVLIMEWIVSPAFYTDTLFRLKRLLSHRNADRERVLYFLYGAVSVLLFIYVVVVP